MTQITKPIIIVGTGRCGSTVFQRLLARHDQVMWLSGILGRHPEKTGWNRRAVTAMGHPMLRRWLGRRIQPAECYRFWDRHAYGFSSPPPPALSCARPERSAMLTNFPDWSSTMISSTLRASDSTAWVQG